jgi:tRNA (mo5U34)-methyltransferase
MAEQLLDRHVARAETERRVKALGKWFHNLELNGVSTAPDHFLGDYPRIKWRKFSHALPEDLRGATVLDVGCNAGFYCFEMKRRGAGRVLGVDSSREYLAQARFAAEALKLDVDFRQLSTYQLSELKERFDIVLFMGVLYHLRHPLLALDLLHEHVVSETLVFQSMQRGSSQQESLLSDYPFSETQVFMREGFPKLHFVEHAYASDPTNWWIPNPACSEAMLRSAGFDIVERAESEVYVCRRRELTAEERNLIDLPEVG